MKAIQQLFPALMMTIVLTVITGIAYPLIVTGLAKIFFKEKAEGSLIVTNGHIIGSKLIGQSFQGAKYFHSRPSAAGKGYDGTASSGTNLGPTSKKLIEDQVKVAAENYNQENPGKPIPVDLVTSSASGLDPHITPAAAEFQIPRVAQERHLNEDTLRKLVQAHTEDRQFGILGEPRINVLGLNIALDELYSIKQ